MTELPRTAGLICGPKGVSVGGSLTTISTKRPRFIEKAGRAKSEERSTAAETRKRLEVLCLQPDVPGSEVLRPPPRTLLLEKDTGFGEQTLTKLVTLFSSPRVGKTHILEMPSPDQQGKILTLVSV